MFMLKEDQAPKKQSDSARPCLLSPDAFSSVPIEHLVIGSCGFRWDKPVHSIEIGYELGSRFWGPGIMIERH